MNADNLRVSHVYTPGLGRIQIEYQNPIDRNGPVSVGDIIRPDTGTRPEDPSIPTGKLRTKS